jgi:tRNA1(Val) A37 N6-methylase TrmN6
MSIPTTDDTLLDGAVIFRQPVDGYRAAIDPVFLAAAVPDGVKGRVLDLGCGAGAAMLCLARRRADLTVVGLERDPALAELAAANSEANQFGTRVTVLTGDLLQPPPKLTVGTFDAVMANPPYLEAADVTASPDPRKAASNVESEADLGDWVRAASRFVKPQGTVIFIHRADRLGDLHQALTKAGCGGSVTIPLWPKAGAQPKRAIVLSQRGNTEPATSGSGLILHDLDGNFSRQAELILRAGSALTSR